MSNLSKELRMSEPDIFSYTIYGLLFSIIKEKDLGWIYSNFIQVMYNDDWQMSIFENHINLLNDCPFMQTYCINFSGREHEFISSIIDAVDNNYYVYLFLDWFYTNSNHTSEHFAHSSVISGYDKVSETFTVYDNFDYGRFAKLKLPFSIVAKSFFSSRTASVGNKHDNDGSERFSYLSDITLIKYNNFVSATIDIENIFFQLKSYVESKKTIYGVYGAENTFGIEVYTSIIDRLKKDEMGLIRDFHLLYEHKLLMCKRIQYLNSFFRVEDLLTYNFREICNEFFILRNTYIKELMLREKSCAWHHKIEEKLIHLANLEIEYINSLMNQIKMYY